MEQRPDSPVSLVNNTSPDLWDFLRTLRAYPNSFDVKIYTDQNFFEAHGVVLCAFSTYFKRVLEGLKEKYSNILLDNVSSECVRYMLDYMYNGRVCVPKETLDDFRSTAARFGLKGMDAEERKSPLQPLFGDEDNDETMFCLSPKMELHDNSLQTSRQNDSEVEVVTNDPLIINIDSSDSLDGTKDFEQSTNEIDAKDTKDNKDNSDDSSDPLLRFQNNSNSEIPLSKAGRTIASSQSLSDESEVFVLTPVKDNDDKERDENEAVRLCPEPSTSKEKEKDDRNTLNGWLRANKSKDCEEREEELKRKEKSKRSEKENEKKSEAECSKETTTGSKEKDMNKMETLNSNKSKSIVVDVDDDENSKSLEVIQLYAEPSTSKEKEKQQESRNTLNGWLRANKSKDCEERVEELKRKEKSKRSEKENEKVLESSKETTTGSKEKDRNRIETLNSNKSKSNVADVDVDVDENSKSVEVIYAEPSTSKDKVQGARNTSKGWLKANRSKDCEEGEQFVISSDESPTRSKDNNRKRRKTLNSIKGLSIVKRKRKFFGYEDEDEDEEEGEVLDRKDILQLGFKGLVSYNSKSTVCMVCKRPIKRFIFAYHTRTHYHLPYCRKCGKKDILKDHKC